MKELVEKIFVFRVIFGKITVFRVTFGKITFLASKIIEMNEMCTFYKKNYLHFIKNCIGPTYKKPKPRKSAFIKNSSFEINRDPSLTDSLTHSLTPV